MVINGQDAEIFKGSDRQKMVTVAGGRYIHIHSSSRRTHLTRTEHVSHWQDRAQYFKFPVSTGPKEMRTVNQNVGASEVPRVSIAWFQNDSTGWKQTRTPNHLISTSSPNHDLRLGSATAFKFHQSSHPFLSNFLSVDSCSSFPPQTCRNV
jgi:hypothetical protein